MDDEVRDKPHPEARGSSAQESTEKREESPSAIGTAEEEKGSVPLSEFRRIYAEMKKWKEKYRSMLGKEELLKEKEEEINRLRGVVFDARVSKALVETAAKLNAVDPQQVAHLLKQFVILDEHLEPVVVDEEGRRRFTRSGSPMSIESLVKEFLAKFPHHRRARLTGGSGSLPPTSGGESNLIESLRRASSLKELERLITENSRRRLEG